MKKYATYTYQYAMRDGETIFRYDNAAHHPERSMPDGGHKHIGARTDNNIVAAEKPSIRAVLREIGTWWAITSNVPQDSNISEEEH